MGGWVGEALYFYFSASFYVYASASYAVMSLFLSCE